MPLFNGYENAWRCAFLAQSIIYLLLCAPLRYTPATFETILIFCS